MTRYAMVRLMAAALFAVLVTGTACAAARVAEGDVDLGSLMLSLLLGLVSFGLAAFLLLFDARRRHQLVRALSSFLSPARLVLRRGEADGDDQREEMRRRLEYAFEGLRSAVGTEPVAVGASGGVLLADGRPPRLTARDALRERRAELATLWPENAPAVEPSPEPEKVRARLPVSPRVAHGAPLVRVTATGYCKTMDVSAARSQLMLLRRADDRSMRRTAVSLWIARVVLLLLVPTVVAFQVLSATSWFANAWDGVGSRGAMLLALALAAAGSVWTVVVTQPDRSFRQRVVSKSASHAIRSLFAFEQLAVQLSIGVPPADAWRAVSLTHHIPPESAIPAVEVEEAVSLVTELRRLARRRHKTGVRRLVVTIAWPVLTCLLPASVIFLLL